MKESKEVMLLLLTYLAGDMIGAPWKALQVAKDAFFDEISDERIFEVCDEAIESINMHKSTESQIANFYEWAQKNDIGLNIRRQARLKIKSAGRIKCIGVDCHLSSFNILHPKFVQKKCSLGTEKSTFLVGSIYDAVFEFIEVDDDGTLCIASAFIPKAEV